jgi:hypothetical protein
MLSGPMAWSSQTRGDARGRAFGDDVLGDGRRGDENDEARSARHPLARPRAVGFVVSWPLTLA